jgi:hypothetical protein
MIGVYLCAAWCALADLFQELQAMQEVELTAKGRAALAAAAKEEN